MAPEIANSTRRRPLAKPKHSGFRWFSVIRCRSVAHSGTAFARLMWVAMLVFHALAIPSLVSSFSSATVFAEFIGPVMRLVALVLSAAFFILKIVDVECLRLNGDWRSIVCIVVLVALVHVGVIDRALGSDLASDNAHIGFVIFAGMIRWRAAIRWALCHVQGLIDSVRLLRRQHGGFQFSFGRFMSRVDEIVARYSQTYLPSYVGPRAPPTS